MTRPVAYVAHPLNAPTREGILRNINRAECWVRYLALVGFAPVATWTTLASAWDEATGRDLGLEIDCDLVRSCDVIVLTGPQLSSGMRHELAAMHERFRPVIDLIDKRRDLETLGYLRTFWGPYVAASANDGFRDCAHVPSPHGDPDCPVVGCPECMASGVIRTPAPRVSEA